MGTHLRRVCDRVQVVCPKGELDLASAPGFHAELRDWKGPAGAPPRLIVDLTGVTFIDCAGLRELCAAQTWAGQQGGWVRVVHTRRSVAVLMRVTRLVERFPRYASVREARRGRVAD